MDEPKRPSWPLAVGTELVQDVTFLSPPTHGFLHRHRHRIKTLLDDGTRTDVFVVDFIDRDASRRNAVVVTLFAPAPIIDDTLVWLRRQMRYAQSRITGHPLCIEMVAGIIEAGEDALTCAQREVVEEVGLELPRTSFVPLGPPVFVLPGTLTEELHFVAARATADQLRTAVDLPPPGDGSPFEEGAHSIVMPLGDALRLCASSRPPNPAHLWIADAKTELSLRRLRESLENK